MYGQVVLSYGLGAVSGECTVADKIILTVNQPLERPEQEDRKITLNYT